MGLYGKLTQERIIKEYIGLKTISAKTYVDNINNTIKVEFNNDLIPVKDIKVDGVSIVGDKEANLDLQEKLNKFIINATLTNGIITLIKEDNSEIEIPISTTLTSLTDIILENLSEGQLLKYDAINNKWKNFTLDLSELGLHFEIVEELPDENINQNTIYLLLKEGEFQDLYDEYVNISGSWEKIGSTQLDLSGFVQKEEGKDLSTNDFSNNYKDQVDTNTINRHTHDNKDILDSITEDFATKLDIEEAIQEAIYDVLNMEV